FFQEYLLGGKDEAPVRRYLRVCHDVCHAAVMFEPQAEVLGAYHAAGIEVGKVQVSAAVRLPLDALAPEERRAAVAQLAAFAEDRYLHQTVVRAGGAETFYEDLPQALAAPPEGEWRVPFHVPIYLERFGRLVSSQGDIRECLDAAVRLSGVRHFEVETYAWGVLPEELR